MSEENKDLGDKAKEAAGDFADGAKKTAGEFSDGLNKAVGGSDNKKVLAGVLAIILGSLGVHKFILGYQKEGFILLGASVVSYVPSMFFALAGIRPSWLCQFE